MMTKGEEEVYNRCMAMGGIFMTSWAKEIERQASIREEKKFEDRSRA